MKKIIYSKCATERKKEYRIITSIIEEDGKKYVCKKPLNTLSEKHVNRMYDVFANDIWENKRLFLTPCKKEKDAVLFDYIEGHTFLEELESLAQKKEWRLFVQAVSDFKDVIYSVDNKQSFYHTELFEAYFGKVDGLEAYEAAEFINIDLLPENIIIKDNQFYVIDYEWIMPFMVPLKYVMFRVLFFSSVFGRIPKDVREEILALSDITEREWQIFLQMEMKFQSQVSDSSLDELYKKMPQDVFYTNNQNLDMKSINCIIVKDNEDNELYYRFSKALSEQVVFTTQCDGDVKIELTDCPCIIKLQQVKMDNELCKDFKTNALLQIIDDYYFVDKAIIEIGTIKGAEISIEYTILDDPQNTLVSLAHALKQNNVLALDKLELEKWNEAYVSRIEELEKELLQIGDERSCLVDKVGEITKELLKVGDERYALTQDVLQLGDEREELSKKVSQMQDERAILIKQSIQLGNDKMVLNNQLYGVKSENELLKEELAKIKNARGWKLYSKINKLG